MIEYTRQNICPETAKSEVSKVIVELYSLCQLRLRKNCQLTLRDLGLGLMLMGYELGLGLVLVNISKFLYLLLKTYLTFIIFTLQSSVMTLFYLTGIL